MNHWSDSEDGGWTRLGPFSFLISKVNGSALILFPPAPQISLSSNFRTNSIAATNGLILPSENNQHFFQLDFSSLPRKQIWLLVGWWPFLALTSPLSREAEALTALLKYFKLSSSASSLLLPSSSSSLLIYNQCKNLVQYPIKGAQTWLSWLGTSVASFKLGGRTGED